MLLKMWVFKWTTSFLCLTWTFGLVYCGIVEPSTTPIYNDQDGSAKPDFTLHLEIKFANITDPIDAGQRAKRAPAFSPTACGIQNGDEPYQKVYTNPEDEDGRIIGGADASHGEFPWQISLQGKPFGTTYRHKCGGALISETIVITGGHCVSGERPENLQIVAGADDILKPTGLEQIRRVLSFSNGFGLHREAPIHDIAVVSVDKPFEFNSKVAPVCLPGPDYVYSGTRGVVTGWGFSSEGGQRPNALQVVQVPIISRDKCREIYEKVQRAEGIQTCNICAGTNMGGRDSCQGDSGGPMTCVEDNGRHFLCGVVSWGIGCGRADSPGVYTYTPCYSTWIREQIETLKYTG